MTEKSILIIGAGLAGLSAGCYARMNGYRAHIFEHHTLPGGVCTAWKRRGYTLDGCLHWLMGSRPGSLLHRVYSEVGALQGNRLILLHEYARFTFESTEQSLPVTGDLARLEQDMRALAPEDADVITELMQGVRAMQGLELLSDKAPELANWLDQAQFMWRLRPVMQYFGPGNISVAAFAERIRNPFLRWVITNFFVPEMPLAFLFMILGQLATGDLSVVEGGSLKFAQAMANRFQALGGQVTYGATVEKILVENHCAVGIQLADGTEHRADVIISAADGHSTLFDMLAGAYLTPAIRERYEKWPLFEPVLIVSLGVTRQFPGQSAENVVALQQPIPIGPQQVDGLWFRIFDYDPTLAPAGKSVVQAMLSTSFDYWNELAADRPRYEAEKERVARAVIDRLECHIPGLAAHVEVIDVATPHTFVRYTRNYRGAFEGWLMTPTMFGVRVEKTLPGLANFYMAGQWVEPGGGVPTAVLSGRYVIQLVCHQDKKHFTAELPT